MQPRHTRASVRCNAMIEAESGVRETEAESGVTDAERHTSGIMVAAILLMVN